MMIRKGIALAPLAVLAACASPAERAAQAQAEIDEIIQVYGPACERLGYRRDDDKWRDCVLHMSAKAERRLNRYPTSTTCFGHWHRGFFHCDHF